MSDSASSERSARVLVVDDDEAMLRSLGRVLRTEGFGEPLLCSDSRQVGSILEAYDVGVVLLDLIMPHASGESLLPEIAARSPDASIIVVTAVDTVDTAVRCIKAGAMDYLVKPPDFSRLVATVASAIRQHSLKKENRELRASLVSPELRHPEIFSAIATQSPAMHSVFRYVEAIAVSPEPVLIVGETGVGKELIANALHRASGRSGEMVAFNIAGIDENAFADTLFGHVKGAFTGADKDREGLIERAAGGTLVLDEIGDLGESMQTKLLRLIQEREYFPLGTDACRHSDCRIVAITNRDLRVRMRESRFREDLYHRFHTHLVRVPPLRERIGDIPLLVGRFLNEATKTMGKHVPTVPRELTSHLSAYRFPGNVRELRAMVMDAVARHDKGVLSLASFHEHMDRSKDTEGIPAVPGAHGKDSISFGRDLPTLQDATASLINEAIRRADGNQGVAARLLGVSRRTVNRCATKSRSPARAPLRVTVMAVVLAFCCPFTRSTAGEADMNSVTQGMSKADVLQIMGRPIGRMRLAGKDILVFQGGEVELSGDRVVSVRSNSGTSPTSHPSPVPASRVRSPAVAPNVVPVTPTSPPSHNADIPVTMAHEILDLEKRFGATGEAKTLLAVLLQKAKARLPTTSRNVRAEEARICLEAIRAFLKDEGYTYMETSFLFEALQTKNSDCDTTSLLYSSIGEVMGYPISIVILPSHAFVRWTLTDKSVVNWETTVPRGEASLSDGFYYDRLMRGLTGEGCNLRALTREQLPVLNHFMAGLHLFAQGRPNEALAEHDRALALDNRWFVSRLQKGNIYLSRGNNAACANERLKAMEFITVDELWQLAAWPLAQAIERRQDKEIDTGLLAQALRSHVRHDTESVGYVALNALDELLRDKAIFALDGLDAACRRWPQHPLPQYCRTVVQRRSAEAAKEKEAPATVTASDSVKRPTTPVYPSRLPMRQVPARNTNQQPDHDIRPTPPGRSVSRRSAK